MAVSGYASTAMVQKWMNLKSKNPSIDLGDFVTCCNCGRIMLVNVGTNKCFNYLDNGRTDDGAGMENILNNAVKNGQTRNIELKYFTVTFYKKGTCHIVFKDEELLKKFNLYGAQKKGWLPPSYGKKTYEEMKPEEKAVVEEFEGKEEYEKTLHNKDFYLVNENAFLIGMDKAV